MSDTESLITAGIVTTIITAIATIVSGFIGGKVAAKATKDATEKGAQLAWDNERRHQDEERRATVRGFLLAVRTEVETIWAGYQVDVAPKIEALKDGEYLDFIYRLRQHYFTVYGSNCHLIGQVEDDDLRQAIVETYVMAKGLIDTHLVNNDLLDSYRSSASDTVRIGILQNLVAFTPEVRNAYALTKESVERLLALLDVSPLLR